MPEEIECPFCPGSTSPVVIEENGYSGRQCGNCGLIFVSPRPSATEIADLYAEGDAYLPPEFFLWASSGLVNRLAAWHNVRILKRHAAPGRLLEIGPGAGTFLKAAQESGFDPWGVELNPQQAQFIRDQLSIPCVASLDELETSAPPRFDVVYSCDVMSHLYDPIAEMQRINTLIAPGGLHIFETGNLGDVAHRHFARMRPFQYPDHLFSYGQRSLQKLLDASGLEHVRTYRYSLLVERMIRDKVRTVTHRRDQAESGAPAVISRPTMPSRKGLLARNALDLAYLSVRMSVGRARIAPDDPQTLVVVARKPA